MKAIGGKSKNESEERTVNQPKSRKEKKRQKIAAGHYAYQPILLYFPKEQALMSDSATLKSHASNRTQKRKENGK